MRLWQMCTLARPGTQVYRFSTTRNEYRGGSLMNRMALFGQHTWSELMRTVFSSSTLKAVALTAVLACGVAAPAKAQGWDWGGEEKVNGSGKTTVRFSPTFKTGALIVSFTDRRLYHVTRPGEAASYPIAVPREKSRWQGVTNVSQKRENPSWTPTGEMRAENPRLPMWVPGGHPMNPLGVRALYLGSSTYRIHGTDAPWTIGQNVSKGCIRMFNQDVIDLYPRIPVGTQVTVTYQSFQAGGAARSASPSDDTQRPAVRRSYRARSASATTTE
jgi:lipoprotein-anchoring transpeptidase ErfK/SrfK